MRRCSVEGCENEYRAKGFCIKHYTLEKRYGCPVNVGSTTDEIKTFIDALPLNSSECIPWPFALNSSGYGVWRGNKRIHRIVCELHSGPPLLHKTIVAHSCGLRRCVNPAHLRWANHQENSNDARRHNTIPHGNKHHGSKLRENDIAKIFDIRARGKSIEKIGREFGVTRKTVEAVLTGKTWWRVSGKLWEARR